MNKNTFPDTFDLQTPSQHYFDSETDADAVAFCNARNALLDQAINGTLYIKFVDGDRKGSIAKLVIDVEEHPYNERKAEVERCRSSWSNEKVQYQIDNTYFFGTAKWDKRKNSCKVSFPSKEIVFLPNYEGPTVYEMFDKKAAKEELLKNPDQHDIDGKLLAVGDKVLYINARYGSGFGMCHGTIKEFKVVADSSGHSFTTVVQMDGEDQLSSISNPSEMIYKK
jgi:hypothetical protein